jgi:hypothetical protein
MANFTDATDVFAAGSVAAEMYNVEPLFTRWDNRNQVELILNPSEKGPNSIKERLDKAIPYANQNTVHFVDKRLRIDHNQRLIAREALKLDFYFRPAIRPFASEGANAIVFSCWVNNSWRECVQDTNDVVEYFRIFETRSDEQTSQTISPKMTAPRIVNYTAMSFRLVQEIWSESRWIRKRRRSNEPNDAARALLCPRTWRWCDTST